MGIDTITTIATTTTLVRNLEEMPEVYKVQGHPLALVPSFLIL